MNVERLTRRQAKIIPLLLTMPVEGACAQAKIAKPTVYQWLKQDHFRAALKKAQDEIFKDAIGKIKSHVSKAVDKLSALVDSDEESIALRAAALTIEHAVKLSVSEDFEQRLSALEGRLNAQRH